MALGDDYIRHRLLMVTDMLEQAVRELNKVQSEIRLVDPPIDRPLSTTADADAREARRTDGES